MNIKKYRLKSTDTTISISKKEIDDLMKNSSLPGIIGQPRALKALQMGIGIKSRGYNIFVTGFSGTGKRTAIKQLLDNMKKDAANLQDITLVYNFRKPDTPRVLYFPAGKGKVFKKDLHQVVENLKNLIKKELESKRVQTQRDGIIGELERRENDILSEFEAKLAKENFHIIQMENGENQVTDITPIYNGQAVDFDELQARVAAGEITEKDWNALRKKYYRFMDEMKKIFGKLQICRNEVEEKLQAISIEAISPLIDSEIDRIINKYNYPNVKEYLTDMRQDINEHIFLFTMPIDNNSEERIISLSRYGVNIIVDNSGNKKAPVISENNPAHRNLFGTVETRIEINGNIRSDFMMIRAGTLLQASGGYLILFAEDILREEYAWQKLKNVLLTGKIEIYQADGGMLVPGSKLKTEPIKVDVKVIIIGTPNLYDYLYSMDEDFQKLFKISAEFDSVVKCNKESMLNYAGFIQKIIEQENLQKINSAGICKIIEYGARLAERQDHLSTRFSQIADLISESDYWAREMGKRVIDAEAVSKAIEEKNYLNNMPEEKLNQMITSGDIMISVTGTAVGKINGLAVLDRGFYAFGRPSLISARIAPGDTGVINIERESGLSGEYHDKGLLILEGYIRSTYAQEFPLSITASICFEQSYAHVDGDSASSTEIYALLSAISGVPLRQDIAVTGSVNQMGEIQPIGGVSEKVEGFYNVCSLKGLTGEQGVMIPVQNIKNLILREDVVQSIKKGEFHIYAVSTINEGIEILTGIKAGETDEEGKFPEGTLNWLVQAKLHDMAYMIKEFGQEHHQEHNKGE